MKEFSKRIILCFLASMLLSSYLSAQFSVDAQLRTRGEGRQGYQSLSQEEDTMSFHISQRTRLSFEYKTDDLKISIAPQDVRIWGDSQLNNRWADNGNYASIDLFEGYAEFRIKDNLWSSIGRQSVKYDNNSIIANRNWNQNGAAIDALILKYKTDSTNIHLATTWNNIDATTVNNYYPSNRIKNLNYLWFNQLNGKGFQYSVIHISAGITELYNSNKILYRHTSGLYAKYTTDSIKVEGNIYYQYGKSADTINVSAFLTDLNLSYKINKLTPGIGLSYLSGNSKTGAEKTTENLFDGLFRARHAYFGNIDYFGNNYASATNDGGLANYFGYLDYKISSKLSARNTFHYFMLAQSNNNTSTDKNLGFENDFILKYKHSNFVNLELGYLFFVPTQNLEQIQRKENSDFSHFVYVQLTINPSLFKGK
jgi:hypothetical protein